MFMGGIWVIVWVSLVRLVKFLLSDDCVCVNGWMCVFILYC